MALCPVYIFEAILYMISDNKIRDEMISSVGRSSSGLRRRLLVVDTFASLKENNDVLYSHSTIKIMIVPHGNLFIIHNSRPAPKL